MAVLLPLDDRARKRSGGAETTTPGSRGGVCRCGRRRRTASASADRTVAKSAWWESGGRSIVGRAANRRAGAELTKRNPSASADLLDSIWGIG